VQFNVTRIQIFSSLYFQFLLRQPLNGSCDTSGPRSLRHLRRPYSRSVPIPSAFLNGCMLFARHSIQLSSNCCNRTIFTFSIINNVSELSNHILILSSRIVLVISECQQSYSTVWEKINELLLSLLFRHSCIEIN